MSENPADVPFDTGLRPDEAEGRLVQSPWGAVATFRRSDGAWVAVDAWCPHVDGPLWEGTRGGEDELACPWHAWRYSLRTGRCTWAPPADAEEAQETELRIFDAELGVEGTLMLLPPSPAE